MTFLRVGDGTETTHYAETTYDAYDNLGRLLRSTSPSADPSTDPDGNISATVYDAIGRATETWAGTDAQGATRTDPGAGTGTNNMVKVSKTNFVDSGSATLLPTSAESLKPENPTGSALEYAEVSFEHDVFRKRTWIKPVKTGPKAHGGAWIGFGHDGAGQPTETKVYAPGSESTVLRKSETVYEGGGRVYATRQFKGATSDYVETLYEYDDVGRQNAVDAPDGKSVTEWDDAGQSRVRRTLCRNETRNRNGLRVRRRGKRDQALVLRAQPRCRDRDIKALRLRKRFEDSSVVSSYLVRRRKSPDGHRVLRNHGNPPLPHFRSGSEQLRYGQRNDGHVR